MELDYKKIGITRKAPSEEIEKGLIKIKAVISCPKCKNEQKFKNQFHLKDIEQMVVSLKVFEFMTCDKCGELLDLNLDFII